MIVHFNHTNVTGIPLHAVLKPTMGGFLNFLSHTVDPFLTPIYGEYEGAPFVASHLPDVDTSLLGINAAF